MELNISNWNLLKNLGGLAVRVKVPYSGQLPSLIPFISPVSLPLLMKNLNVKHCRNISL